MIIIIAIIIIVNSSVSFIIITIIFIMINIVIILIIVVNYSMANLNVYLGILSFNHDNHSPANQSVISMYVIMIKKILRDCNPELSLATHVHSTTSPRCIHSVIINNSCTLHHISTVPQLMYTPPHLHGASTQLSLTAHVRSTTSPRCLHSVIINNSCTLHHISTVPPLSYH